MADIGTPLICTVRRSALTDIAVPDGTDVADGTHFQTGAAPTGPAVEVGN